MKLDKLLGLRKGKKGKGKRMTGEKIVDWFGVFVSPTSHTAFEREMAKPSESVKNLTFLN